MLSWIVVIIAVLAIFNAEKLPALRQMMEEKFKDSVVAAKEGSKVAKSKIKKVKVDILKFRQSVRHISRARIENFRKTVFTPHGKGNPFAVAKCALPFAILTGFAVLYGAVARKHQRRSAVDANPARQFPAKRRNLRNGQFV